MKPKPRLNDPLSAGKLPPQAIALEEAVLGACMLNPAALNDVAEILQPDAFYADAHQRIFRAFLAMEQRCQVVDMLTVTEYLNSTGLLDAIGGPYTIVKLTNAVTSSASIDQHARIILQKFIQREVIRVSADILSNAYDNSTDVFDLLDDAETKIFNITRHYLKHDFKHSNTVMAQAVDRIDALRTSVHQLSGVTSGLHCIDHITYGWQPSDLIILAARPGVGKTALALNFARNAAMCATNPIPVGFFSLEMSAIQLIQRLMSAESGVPLQNINRGKLTDTLYTQLHKQGITKLHSMNMFIDDTAALNIFEFRAKARRMVNKHKCGLIIIDYLQLMSGHGERTNREQEISTISRNLKALAKELNVPIIALSQLSRAVEMRGGAKMPQLSDLRESGAIEQDADLVMFIYRDDYYQTQQSSFASSQSPASIGMQATGQNLRPIKTSQQGPAQSNTAQEQSTQYDTTNSETHIKIAKHRNGTLGNIIKLRARLSVQKFEEWEGSAPSYHHRDFASEGL